MPRDGFEAYCQVIAGRLLASRREYKMIYEMAVADAYAIAFEFVSDPAAHGLRNDLATYQQHPKYDGLKPSQYTDDTQRSIVNAKVVLSHMAHDPYAFVRGMQREFRDDPRDGYSRNFQQFMIDNQNTYPLDWVKAITLRRASNGSIMGAAPLGYLAMITHSVATAPCAQAIALAAHYFIYDLGPKDELLAFLLDEVEDAERILGDIVLGYGFPVGPVPMQAGATMTAVLQLIHKHDSLTDILQEAVMIGGDTDSVAALSVGIASTSREVTSDLPAVLMEGVEFGDKGTQRRLLDLDFDLRDRAAYETKRSG
jgi:ADP-ribosyl-[dinitrogen reductase] hydrolase